MAKRWPQDQHFFNRLTPSQKNTAEQEKWPFVCSSQLTADVSYFAVADLIQYTGPGSLPNLINGAWPILFMHHLLQLLRWYKMTKPCPLISTEQGNSTFHKLFPRLLCKLLSKWYQTVLWVSATRGWEGKVTEYYLGWVTDNTAVKWLSYLHPLVTAVLLWILIAYITNLCPLSLALSPFSLVSFLPLLYPIFVSLTPTLTSLPPCPPLPTTPHPRRQQWQRSWATPWKKWQGWNGMSVESKNKNRERALVVQPGVSAVN